MDLSVLVPDLQELVMFFAWNVPMKAVRKSLSLILELKKRNVPWFFLRTNVWSWHYHRKMISPTIVFAPLEYFGGHAGDLVNFDVLYYFLYTLDFRQREVRMFGTRTSWIRNLGTNWRTIFAFSEFYKLLFHCKGQILKKGRDIYMIEAELTRLGNTEAGYVS